MPKKLIMAQIRGTIELLTRILFDNGTQKVKAEMFRAAKFNGLDGSNLTIIQDVLTAQETTAIHSLSEAADKYSGGQQVAPLWKLLFELVSYCEFGKIDEVTVRACNELSAEELVVYVKRELQRRGYNSLHFAGLPNDMVAGSRELLLAFGWLLGSERIIDRFMINCTAPLDDDTATLHLKDSGSLSSSLSSGLGMSYSMTAMKSATLSPCQRVEQLLAFNNKLRMSLRGLYSVQCERNFLKHKIHEATSNTGSSKSVAKHLSMLEVYLMRHPDMLRKHIDLLEQDNERLRNLLQWKEVEGVFWRWMESILEEKKTANQRNERADEDDPVGDSMKMDYTARMESSHCSLQQAILKYESIVEHLERLCQNKIEDVSSEEIDHILSAINKELCVQKMRLAERGYTSRLVQPVEPRFILDKRKGVSKKLPETSNENDEQWFNKIQLTSANRVLPYAGEESSTVSTLPERDIEDEIAMLREVANSLDHDVDALRSKYEEQMRQLAFAHLHDAAHACLESRFKEMTGVGEIP